MPNLSGDGRRGGFLTAAKLPGPCTRNAHLSPIAAGHGIDACVRLAPATERRVLVRVLDLHEYGTYLAPGTSGQFPRTAPANRCRHGMSRMTAIVSRNWAEQVEPTLPRVVMTLLVETARRCWHWAAECATSPFASSGSMTTSEWNRRIVLVTGTTWTTDGVALRMR